MLSAARWSWPSSRHPVARHRAGEWSRVDDELAEEVPVAFEYNGISHAVMMATPTDLQQFALGFSLSEGIVGASGEVYDIDIDNGAAGVTLHIEIAGAAFDRLKRRRRSLLGRTGCGLCGVDSLDQALRPLPRLAPCAAPSAAAIATAIERAQLEQPLNRRTGATHAALWCDPGGSPRMAFEDVGRHNALDKLIGALALAGPRGDGFVLLTSRASVEMVQKAAIAGLGVLVAMSAPTALAVRTAARCGMTLVAFARGTQFAVYTEPVSLAR